jgi:hypothetical protein
MPNGARTFGIASHRPRQWRGKRLCKHRIGAGAIGIVLLWAGIGAMAEEALAVPSGQEVRFLETVQSAPGPDGLAIRFRFVAPAIARTTGTIGAEAAQADMEWLCNNYALPRLPAAGPVPSQIIVSLSDREVAFGEPAPETTQFFEAYAVEGGHCVWEAF